MNLVTDKLPEPNQVVIAYCPDNVYYFARYRKALTWRGNKFKFVNLMSKGFWNDDVIGWNSLPTRDNTSSLPILHTKI